MASVSLLGCQGILFQLVLAAGDGMERCQAAENRQDHQKVSWIMTSMKPIKRWTLMDKKGRLMVDCYGDLHLWSKKPTGELLVDGEIPVKIEIRQSQEGRKT
jgi:hypothetical protein